MKFTKASKNDGFKVTATVSELYSTTTMGEPATLEVAKFFRLLKQVGTEVILDVEGIPTVFTVNRAGKTLCTKSFPPGLRRPSVGNPVNYHINRISAVTGQLAV